MPPIERHIQVHRTARYFVLGDLGAQTREVWVACHGYGQLAESFAWAMESVVGDGRVVVAPEGMNRFYLEEPFRRHGPEAKVGAAWMTREDRDSDISDNIAYLDAICGTVISETGRRDVKITALGFSQGVATVCRWAAFGRVRPQRLILWEGGVAADLPSDRGHLLFNGAPVVMVSGLGDPIMTPKIMKKERQTLADLGIDVEYVEFEGSHALNSETLRRLSSGA